jgi:uncharacterized protein
VTDILITGGSDGIGLASAKLLATNGTRLTLVARREASLRDAVALLPGEGHDFLAADLSQPDGIGLVTHRIGSRHYDVLVNNAGIGLYGNFAELPLDDQLGMMRLNMESLTALAHSYLRQARPGDALVNTASFLAYAPLPGAAAYSATKAFVAALSETLWWETRTGTFTSSGSARGSWRLGSTMRRASPSPPFRRSSSSHRSGLPESWWPRYNSAARRGLSRASPRARWCDFSVS